MTNVSVVERGYSALAIELSVPDEVFQLALLAAADDEINVHAPAVRQELQHTAPPNLDELVVVLERRGSRFDPSMAPKSLSHQSPAASARFSRDSWHPAPANVCGETHRP